MESDSKGESKGRASKGKEEMPRRVLGNSFVVVIAPILLYVLVHKLLNKRRASADRNTEDPNLLYKRRASANRNSKGANRYDVFLSFRGTNTRRDFTDHLYYGLIDAGIHVFRDNDELHEGERIDPDLLEDIENSKILMPIISPNYASSKWCLDVLVHMTKCMRSSPAPKVLPIFYKVESADVQQQIGSFGEAFNYFCQGRCFDTKVVEGWKKALTEVSSLQVEWKSEKVANGNEGELIKLIAREVLSELKSTMQFVGIDNHVKEVMEIINKSSGATLCLGIYGMGGIGKTTLVKVIYDKLFDLFEYHNFIQDVKESCQRKGMVYLQSQLISTLGETIQFSFPDEGIAHISSKFRHKKVLIVLDDVHSRRELERLVNNPNWFGRGSIIIITSRSKRTFKWDGGTHEYWNGATHEYELKQMDEEQSLILFSRHAFQRDSPPSEFLALSRLVVSTMGGLPLALKVVGSSLYGKQLSQWRVIIKKIQNVPPTEVQQVLKRSYDALDCRAKEIFLDIACFLIGNDVRIAAYMWPAKFYPDMMIEGLRYSSLINIGDNYELRMHNYTRDLGREIVRQESCNKPHMRSRLWDYEEALEVLLENKRSKRIEAICLEKGNSTRIADQGSLTFTPEQFRRLPYLCFLHMSDVNLTGDFGNIFSNLRWLKWGNCPSNFEATNLHAEKLVILDLSGSPITDDWEGWHSMMQVEKLKVLNLTGCHSLKGTSYLAAFKQLEILILRDCSELEQIDPCVGDVETLLSLDLRGCPGLKELPPQMDKLKRLEELLLDQTGIQEIPSSICFLKELKKLSAKDCKKLVRLPDLIDNLMHLSILVLRGCVELVALPNNIGFLYKLECLPLGFCHQLREIPNSIGELRLLTELDLRGCSRLEELPPKMGELKQLKELLLDRTLIREIPSDIGSLEKLETVSAEDCESLRRLPESIGNLVNLSTLVLSGCVELVALPNNIGFLENLRCLSLGHCHNLRDIPNSIGKLKLLTQLDLSGCLCLEEIPPKVGELEQLKELLLDQTPIQEIPSYIESLEKLEMLSAKDCKSLLRLSDSIGNLVNLSTLVLSGCVELAALPDSIGFLENLQCLLLGCCHRLTEIPNSIEELKLLTQLDLSGCSHLEKLPPQMGELEELKKLLLDQTMIQEIPSSIGSLKKLEMLNAKDCKSLFRLSDSIGNLVNLSTLVLSGCVELVALPDSIGSLENLQCLSLGHCHRIREIPNSIGKLKMLTQLDLSGCSRLEKLPPQMGELEQLKELLLDQTMIQKIPSSIGSLEKLETLSARDCKSLVGLPDSMGSLVNLSTLVLSGCVKLVELPDSIGSLENLRCLSLGHCHRMREIPNSIGKLKMLTQLDLSWTRITELPKSIGDLQNLGVLNVIHSSIERLPWYLKVEKALRVICLMVLKIWRRISNHT